MSRLVNSVGTASAVANEVIVEAAVHALAMAFDSAPPVLGQVLLKSQVPVAVAPGMEETRVYQRS